MFLITLSEKISSIIVPIETQLTVSSTASDVSRSTLPHSVFMSPLEPAFKLQLQTKTCLERNTPVNLLRAQIGIQTWDLICTKDQTWAFFFFFSLTIQRRASECESHYGFEILVQPRGTKAVLAACVR